VELKADKTWICTDITLDSLFNLFYRELHDMGITNQNDVNLLIRESQILRYKIEEVHNNSVAV